MTAALHRIDKFPKIPADFWKKESGGDGDLLAVMKALKASKDREAFVRSRGKEMTTHIPER